MQYEFGAASALYDQCIHPRVFLGPDDLPVLKQRIQSGDGRKIAERIREKIAPIVERINASDDVASLLEKGTQPYTSFGWVAELSIPDMALMCLLDGDEAAGRAAQRAVFGDTHEQGRIDLAHGAIAYDLLYDQLSKRDRTAFVRAAAAYCRQTAARPNYLQGAGGNKVLGGMTQALRIYLATRGDPGMPGLEREVRTLLQRFEATLHTAVNPEGYPEEDNGYGTGVTSWLVQLAELLRRAGLHDAYARAPRLAKFGRAVLHFAIPWGGGLIITGDHPPTIQEREFSLARLAAYNADPSLTWVLGRLPESGRGFGEYVHEDYFKEVTLAPEVQVPATWRSLLMVDSFKPRRHPKSANVPLHYCDPGRGIVSLRNGWDDDDALVHFDGSQRNPAGQGHAHASCGHFSLYTLGEAFAIDTSRYCNDQDQHNLVLIDGRSRSSSGGEWTATNRAGRLTAFEPNPFVDTAAVDSSHQHNCYWARRTVGLVKGDADHTWFWTVDDLNRADDWAEFWWQLQTSPENKIQLKKRSATIRGWRQGNMLDVHFVLLPGSQFPDPHTLELAQDVQTVSAHKYVADPHQRARDYRQPREMIHGIVYERPRLLAKVAGYNGRFMSVLVPRRRGRKAAQVRALKTLDNALAVRVTFEGVEDTLVWAYDHQLLEADGLSGIGQWAAVRRRREDGKVLKHAMGEGTHLAIDGERLV